MTVPDFKIWKSLFLVSRKEFYCFVFMCRYFIVNKRCGNCVWVLLWCKCVIWLIEKEEEKENSKKGLMFGVRLCHTK